MADYSVALGVQGPRFDPSQALSLAAQMQQQKFQQEQAAQSLQMDQERLNLAREQAGLQRQVTQSQLADAQGRRNALAEYVKAQQGGDPNAVSKLAAYPEIQSSVLQVRNQMDEANRAKFDQSLIRNARRAQYVSGLQGEAKNQAWQASLKEALDAGDISPQQYQQYSQTPPNDLLLHNVISQATPIQQIYAQNEPTPTQRELKSAGIEPRTPEYQAVITGGKLLPKFEKVGGRLFRTDPVSGEATDVTPGGPAAPTSVFEKPEDRVEFEQKLRKEYTALTTDLRSINDSLGRLRASSQDNSGPGDIAMVYSYMKMLDPTSVVREGEYATAEQTAGLPQQVVGLYNKLLTGERLTPQQRGQFLNSAEIIAKDKDDRFAAVREQYSGIARAIGLDPAAVMLDEGRPRSPTGPIQVKSPEEAQQLIQSGRLKKGDTFIDDTGTPRTVN